MKIKVLMDQKEFVRRWWSFIYENIWNNLSCYRFAPNMTQNYNLPPLHNRLCSPRTESILAISFIKYKIFDNKNVEPLEWNASMVVLGNILFTAHIFWNSSPQKQSWYEHNVKYKNIHQSKQGAFQQNYYSIW